MLRPEYNFFQDVIFLQSFYLGKSFYVGKSLKNLNLNFINKKIFYNRTQKTVE